MSIGKKYYLKLDSDFFQRLKVKKLRKSKKGDTYTCIYLKLLLLSTKTFGLITFQNIENTLYEELALIVDEEIEDVKHTMDFLEKEKILLPTDENEYVFENLCDEVITETESARRMRKHREKIREKTMKMKSSLHSDNNVVTPLSHSAHSVKTQNHNVRTMLSQCENAKSHCDNNVVTPLSQCNKEKKDDNFSANTSEYIISLGDEIADKIIPVIDADIEEK